MLNSTASEMGASLGTWLPSQECPRMYQVWPTRERKETVFPPLCLGLLAVWNHPQRILKCEQMSEVLIWDSPPSPSSHHHTVTFNLLNSLIYADL